MAAEQQYVNRDIVSAAVSGPIDWTRFEELVHGIMVADDFPRLERIGGVNDHGVDALEESFYDGMRRITTIVQVTSAVAQRAKVKDTIKKLKAHKIDVRTLVFVSRHPISSENRRQIIEEAENEGVAVEVRDDSYLIAQLSKPGSPLFARFFGTTKDQFDALVSQPDPLKTSTSKAQHALLATLGAFVLSPRARIARNTLFDKTLLAVIATSKDGVTQAEAMAVLKTMPGVDADVQQVQGSLLRLQNDGSCVETSGKYACSDKALENVLRVAQAADTGFKHLVAYVSETCTASHKLSDAQLGFLERNVRRALLSLLRTVGPVRGYEERGLSQVQGVASDEVRKVLGRDLPPDVTKRALAALATYASSPENAQTLAPLIRSYGALALRNVDPAGRRWQRNTLSRNCVALDTDALLYLIVEELPEHTPLITAVRNLQSEGVALIIPSHVLDEAVAHIGRFYRTFSRFSRRLLQMPPQAVHAQVWHAVVRAYYFAVKNGAVKSPDAFLSKYWEPSAPREYVERLLARRLDASIQILDVVPDHLWDDLNELELVAMDFKERNRMKAEFRDLNEMAARVRADLSMALNLAERPTSRAASPALGYLASSDRMFKIIERQAVWKSARRPRVALETRAVPELASFVCGTALSDDEALELLFHPLSVAAAELMADDITVLTSMGFDLHEVPIDRLEWDLSHELRDQIDGLERAVLDTSDNSEASSAAAALSLAKAAATAGYAFAKPIETLLQSYEESIRLAEQERGKRQEAEKALREFAAGALQTTAKGKTKINRLMKQLGIKLGTDEES